jgi:Zn-dependent protease
VTDTNGAAARCTCGVEIAPGLLACPACRRLVHAARLAGLAAEAEAAEREGRVTDALSAWRTALPLLPTGTSQGVAIGQRIRRLGDLVDGGGAQAPGTKNVAGGAAGLGAAAAAAWKLKFALVSVLGKLKLLVTGLASLPTALSMLAWLSLDRGQGATFALGLVGSIYVHEMGHVAALRTFGIEATAPMFIPGLGALVRLRQYPADAREDARVGLAGPVWGSAAALFALALGAVLSNAAVLRVASLGASINLFNLVPFWQLDGARGMRALTARQRGVVVALAAAAALLTGQTMGWVVCAVAAVRARSDLPPEGDARAFRTFAGLVVALPAIAWIADRVLAVPATLP